MGDTAILNPMLIKDFARWADEKLSVKEFRAIDDSLNGLQIGDEEGEVKKIAFAVDACLESILRAREAGAQMLFVHHGLFWGKPEALTGRMYRRIRACFDGGLALYGCHLPLDAHPELGNNIGLARLAGLKDIEPFGIYKGRSIGFKGRLEPAISLDDFVARILPGGDDPFFVYPFGKKLNTHVAIVSGGAPFDSFQAIEDGMDLFLTGESSHSIYRHVEEAGLNVVSAGHYATEIHGVKAVSGLVAEELGLETVFLDLPTGL